MITTSYKNLLMNEQMKEWMNESLTWPLSLQLLRPELSAEVKVDLNFK